jgi:hypothetical protein
MSMAPPPSAEFNSREELLDFQKDWAENQGFAVVIGRSRPNRLWIKCDRGGEYSDKHLNDPENRKRKRKATRLTGCPFNIKATMKKDKIWRCHTEIGEHNHGPSEDLSIHPSLRRMTDEQLRKVNEMTEAGNTPVETLDELQRLWPGIKVLRRDIYNARKKYKTEKELADFASTQNNQTPQGVSNTNGQPPAFTDANGQVPGPPPTGRWEWLEEGDEVKRKKRKKSSLSGPPPPPPPPPQRPPQQASAGQIPQANLAPELRDQALPSQAQTAPLPNSARRQTNNMNNAARRNMQQAPQPSPVPQQHFNQGMRPPEQDFSINTGAPNRSPSTFRHYNPPAGQPPQRPTYRTPSQSSATGESIPTQSQYQGQAQAHHQLASQSMQQQQQQQQQQQGQSLRAREVAGTMPIGPMVSPVNGNAAPVPTAAPQASAIANNPGGAKHPNGQAFLTRIERMEREQNQMRKDQSEMKSMLQQVLGAVSNGVRQR